MSTLFISFEDILSEDVFQDKRKRDRRIAKAVKAYGYTQREIADYIGMHFTSISRIMRRKLLLIK